jgi:hypothetical protein
MRLTPLAASLLLLSISLAGCLSIGDVPAGPFASGAHRVTLGRQWAEITTLMPAHAKQMKVLTIDGPLLNRLYIVDGLPEGAWLMKPVSKDKPTPVVRKGMSARERIEFVADNVAAFGYQDVATARPRPAKAGEVDAVRFDLTARTAEGLEMSGTAQVAEKDGKLFLILYLAPTEHYYAALLPEVETVMGSMRVG